LPLLRSEKRIDLLISEVVLPHVNGRKFAEMAQALHSNVNVLFVSGYAENAAVRGDFLAQSMDMIAVRTGRVGRCTQ